jgi:hypothetical protein
MDDYLHLTTTLKDDTIGLDLNGWVLNGGAKLFIEYVDETKASFYIYCTTKKLDRRHYMIAGNGVITNSYLSLYEYTKIQNPRDYPYESVKTEEFYDKDGLTCHKSIVSWSIAEFCIRKNRLYLIQRNPLPFLGDVFTKYIPISARITAFSVKLKYAGSTNAELFAQVRVH